MAEKAKKTDNKKKTTTSKSSTETKKKTVKSAPKNSAQKNEPPQKVVFCSFCNREPSSLRLMIAGPNNIFICEECIEVCVRIFLQVEIEDEQKSKEFGGKQKRKPKALLWQKRLLEIMADPYKNCLPPENQQKPLKNKSKKETK